MLSPLLQTVFDFLNTLITTPVRYCEMLSNLPCCQSWIWPTMSWQSSCSYVRQFQIFVVKTFDQLADCNFDRVIHYCKHNTTKCLIFTACIEPRMPYHFEGTFYDDGWIHVNQSLIYECSDNREFHSSCVTDANDSYHGVWEPEIICPPVQGE